ncbi:endoplasmic reticulum metallopeptidase 1 isoform X3 [Alosa sapidissima]|uniref:endoplasmic reticulum metallopeptidase 1 isoform X3 n=1 Tax=Alosa sapidissima TaxID=34773 RepID=UPI001C0A1699|nr:endoplasmic reticulum metallopeptidase 1 isoform X3 [Alosa sapidissima]
MESDTTVRRIKLHAIQNDIPEDSSYAHNRHDKYGYGDIEKKSEINSYLLREGVAAVLVVAFILVLWGLVHLSLQQLVLGRSTGEFNALRARKHLESITSVGPRPVGSVENEVMTVGYLLAEIEHIREESMAGPHAITVDVQRPTGSFSIDFLGGFTSYYDKVTNIAVKLEPKNGAQHLMLANCHFDSVANSPGASDDAVSCAVMLEVLHSLANLSTPLLHGVVFLFNGAEENVLQASHGFITQHPWAKKVRAFINLEAAGVGGKEVVFQTGPENPWLVQAYVHAAKHPFASVVGQEVFQSGVIPSDTDFRIYRDFGNIPGIDLAFIENGYIYHTKYDTADRILTDSIQRAGDNILAVLKHLVMSEKLADASEYRHGNMVFFDLLGLVVVAYPARVGTIINCIVTMATFFYLGKKCMLPSNMGGRYIRELVYAVGVALLSWLVTLLSVLIVALLVTLLGRSMFWYNHFYASICLYGAASTGKMILIHTLAKNLYYGHTTRTFHGLDGQVAYKDSGLWINSFDYTAMRHITPHIPEINDTIRKHCQEDLPFCGFPWFLPMKFLVKKNWYLPAEEVSPKFPMEFKLLSKYKTEWGTIRMSFEAKGPSHMSLYLFPYSGATLTSWSFGDGIPQFDLSGEYFIFYSHGLEAPAWNFWLEIQPSSTGSEEGMISMAISSHYFFGEDKLTPQLEVMLQRFPLWAFPSSWVSTYNLYRY